MYTIQLTTYRSSCRSGSLSPFFVVPGWFHPRRFRIVIVIVGSSHHQDAVLQCPHLGPHHSRHAKRLLPTRTPPSLSNSSLVPSRSHTAGTSSLQSTPSSSSPSLSKSPPATTIRQTTSPSSHPTPAKSPLKRL